MVKKRDGNGSEEDTKFQPPEGAEDDGGGWEEGIQERPDGFWNLVPNHVLQGVLLKKKRKEDDLKKGEMRTVYYIRLTNRAPATLPKKDGQTEGDKVYLNAGKILQADERDNISGLSKLLDTYGEGAREIRITVGEKRKIPGKKNTVWDMKWNHRPAKDDADEYDRS